MKEPHWLTRHRGKIVRIGTKLAVVCAVTEKKGVTIARVLDAENTMHVREAGSIREPKDGDRERFDAERKRLALKSSRP